MSQLAQAAVEVSMAMTKASPHLAARISRLATLATEVEQTFRRQRAAVDREAEWQRVHSYIADVLKDTHVLYAKLARLEGDFAGEELVRLERISEAVLALGNELSAFSKAFYEGKYSMADTEFTYGGEGGGEGGEGKAPPAPPPEEAGAAEALLGEEQTGGGEGQGQGQAQAEEQESQQ
jgi:hypothetical protein